jgi:hypothetical protein
VQRHGGLFRVNGKAGRDRADEMAGIVRRVTRP